MNKFELILQIEAFFKSRYNAWCLGITDRPMEREFELRHPKNWHVWEADTQEIAKEIEELFVQKGCKCVYGDSGRFIYMFSS